MAPFETHVPTDPELFQPYNRDPQTLSRPWALLGTPGFEHRLGGLEKEHLTGNVSYNPENHEMMIRMRAEKVQRVIEEIPATEIYGEESGDLLLVGWGSTFGSIRSAAATLQSQGKKVSSVHIRHLHPLPPDLGDIFARFKTVAAPEMNLGQLAMLLRAKTLVDIKPITKLQGKPFKESELVEKSIEILEGNYSSPYLIETLEKVIEGPLAKPETSVH